MSAWRSEISRHFIEEEQALLPFACPPLDPRTPAIAEMLAQHAIIRRLVLDLQRAQHAGDEAACLQLAAPLGEALDAHIRMEERDVFEALQEALSDEQIVALGTYLAAWEGAASNLD